MISRCIALSDQPVATNRVASQSNSGWLSGGSPSRAEVVGQAHQSFAKMPLPEAIDHHAAGQRMIAAA